MSVSSLSDIFASKKLEKAIRQNFKGMNKRPPLSPLPPKAHASHMKHEKNDKISKFQYIFEKDQETLQNISNSRNKRGPHRTVKLAPISKSELKARAISRCSAGILPSIQKKQNRSLSNASANTIPILSNFQDLFHINNCPFEIKRENRGIRNKSENLREKPSSALPIPSSPLPIPSSPLQTPSKYKENLVNQFSTIKKLKKNFFNFSESSTVTPESTPPTFSKGSMMFFKKLRVAQSKKTQDPFCVKMNKAKKANKVIQLKKRLMSDENRQKYNLPDLNKS
ncbi:unnamed protein product [Moneuplotes crassus]|uniref:Uncharacterized protein n=1 Tax=Euplotes crassus TaxID=5936 RepID=A0AAD1UD03_EUPCR|nr:unnamed protein product [Moneuplotes crassus]